MDGVASTDGWLCELNSRRAGMMPAARAADLPILGLSRVLVAGETAGLDAAEIEEIAVTAADEKRHIGGMTVIDRPVAATETVRVHWDGTAVRTLGEGEGEGNAVLERGPSAAGGAVRFTLDPEHVPGTLRPVVAAAFAAADELWDTGRTAIPAVALRPRRLSDPVPKHQLSGSGVRCQVSGVSVRAVRIG
jgi:hypothetical protein